MPTRQLPAEEPGRVECHLAPGGAQCAIPDVLPAWQRAALLAGERPERAAAPRVAATLAYAQRGGGCEAGLRVRAVALRRALRRETAPLVEVDSGGVACEASVSVEARLTEEEAQRLQALRDLCPGFFALPGKWGLDRQHRRRKPITEKQRSGVSFARTAQGAYITRVG